MASFERLSATSRLALQSATTIAAQTGANRVTPVHLLLGLASLTGSPAGQALVLCGLRPPEISADVEHAPEFDSSLNAVLMSSLREAIAQGRPGITPEDLLASVVAHRNADADAFLSSVGVTRELLRNVLQAVAQAPSDIGADTPIARLVSGLRAHD